MIVCLLVHVRLFHMELSGRSLDDWIGLLSLPPIKDRLLPDSLDAVIYNELIVARNSAVSIECFETLGRVNV